MLGSLLLVFLMGCATNGVAPSSELYGAFECVDRGAVAAPPGMAPPMSIDEERQQKSYDEKPLISETLCDEGSVPLAKPALPNVAKGNPLLGTVDLPTKAFFDKNEDQSDAIKKSRRPFEDVYFFGPGLKGEDKTPPDPPGCNGVSYYGSCYYYGSASYRRVADGGGMTMTIERPAYDGSGGSGHSLDEIAVQGGAGDGDIIELGWNVSTSQYTDANPHLFVFHWIGWGPTCYDGCGWVQYSATYFPGMNLSALVGRAAYVGWVYYEGNWWAWFDNQWLGYFPGSEWSGGYTKTTIIQWFGEISTANGIPPRTDMGNGLFPANPAAAENATLCDVNAADWVCWYRDQQNWGATFPTYYDIDRSGFGRTRYGGNGGG